MITPLPHNLPFQPAYIFTDIDDTLTLDGRLPLETYSALYALQHAGIRVVPVTGGCGGWCDCILRTWPIDTIIGENGAFIMSMEKERLCTTFVQDNETRRANRQQLDELLATIKDMVPEARLTGDCQYRITDIAYDIGQDRILSEEKVREVLQICAAQGVHARASSIHINIWLGDYSKCTTSLYFLDQIGLKENQTIFIGDSCNDEAMFSGWSTTVGVANIKSFLPQLTTQPTYITQKPGGLGFAELTDVVLRG